MGPIAGLGCNANSSAPWVMRVGRSPKGKSRNSPLMDSDALCSSDRTIGGSSGAFSKVAAATMLPKLVETETWLGNSRRSAVELTLMNWILSDPTIRKLE